MSNKTMMSTFSVMIGYLITELCSPKVWAGLWPGYNLGYNLAYFKSIIFIENVNKPEKSQQQSYLFLLYFTP